MKASTLYVPAVAVMALLTIAVTWRGWLDPTLSDPCLRPAELRRLDAVPGTELQPEDLSRLSSDTMQWSRAQIANPERPDQPMEALLVRSYGPGVFRLPPTHYLSRRLESGAVDIERAVEGGDELPIHVVYETAQDPSRVVAYLFIHGNTPVERPFLATVRSSWDQLWNGRLPLTVLVIGGFTPRRTLENVRHREVAWLRDAWHLYRQSCIEGVPVRNGERDGRAP